MVVIARIRASAASQATERWCVSLDRGRERERERLWLSLNKVFNIFPTIHCLHIMEIESCFACDNHLSRARICLLSSFPFEYNFNTIDANVRTPHAAIRLRVDKTHLKWFSTKIIIIIMYEWKIKSIRKSSGWHCEWCVDEDDGNAGVDERHSSAHTSTRWLL